jgi:hypothetical protein
MQRTTKERGFHPMIVSPVRRKSPAAAIVEFVLLLSATLPASPAVADASGSWLNSSTYTYQVTHVPDLDQRRAILPGQGSMYCVPTASMNWMAYFANHGASMAPGPGNWQSQTLYATMTGQLGLMGSLMGTSDTDGTYGDGWNAGLHAWLPNNLFIFAHYYCNDTWCPDFQYCAEHAFNGGYVIPIVGWYGEFKFDPGVIQRNGGHALSLNGAQRSGSDMIIKWRDPANDEGSGDPLRLIVQSPFGTESYPIQQRYLRPIQFSNFRWMSKIVGYDNAHIDEMVAIYPLFALSSQPDDLLDFSLLLAHLPAGSIVGSLRNFHSIVDTSIRDIALHPDLLSVLYITDPQMTGDPPRIWRLMPGTGEITMVDVPLENPTRLIVGRRRGLYVLDGDDLVCLEIDTPTPDEVIRITPPAPPDALTYDDAADQLVLLSSSARQVIRYPYYLDALPMVFTLPDTVALAGRAKLACDPTNGAVWMVSDGSDSVYELTVSPASGQLVSAEVSLPEIVAPRAVDVGDSGHVFVSTQGHIVELELVGAGWQVAANPAFPDTDAGEFLRVARSSSNFDPALYTGPDWSDVLPEEFNPSVPDCTADLDGDGMVGVTDFLRLLAVWGTADPFADIAPDGGDGNVGVEDFLFMLAAWGACP